MDGDEREGAAAAETSDIGAVAAPVRERRMTAGRKRDAVLRLICSFDMDPPADRMPAIYQTINLANDRVWDGAFTFCAPQRQMVWRYGLVLAGDAIALPEQVDRMIGTALAACERFYPSFQLAGWGGTSPAAALEIALGETYGRA